MFHCDDTELTVQLSILIIPLGTLNQIEIVNASQQVLYSNIPILEGLNFTHAYVSRSYSMLGTNCSKVSLCNNVCMKLSGCPDVEYQHHFRLVFFLLVDLFSFEELPQSDFSMVIWYDMHHSLSKMHTALTFSFGYFPCIYYFYFSKLVVMKLKPSVSKRIQRLVCQTF